MTRPFGLGRFPLRAQWDMCLVGCSGEPEPGLGPQTGPLVVLARRQVIG